MGVMETEALPVGDSTDEDGFVFIPAEEDPSGAVAAINAAVSESSDSIPLIDPPPADTVRLPAGLVQEGEVYREATVRELNGEDEEHLSRALVSGNASRYIEMLLERGVVKIGPVTVDSKILDSLLVGDREMLILGIRQATYGDELETKVVCSGCGVESTLKVTLSDDVPVKPLDWDAREVEHEIPLRKGLAIVRLATGADQRFLNTLENKTASELNTELLARCVKRIDGKPVKGLLQVRGLGMADRRSILDWMADHQPGPEYDKVINECTVCKKESPLDITAAALFPAGM